MSYDSTLSRVETYFDRTATQTWERLTSDAPVSKIRATVRAGREEMFATVLSRLPGDMSGQRVLDAGCGTGTLSLAMAERGAEVVGVDISPNLIEIAQKRHVQAVHTACTFRAYDMLAEDLGEFDHVVAVDSLIYYRTPDLKEALAKLSQRCPHIVFTVAPKTPFLMAFWYAGKLFPRSDRSPVMNPQNTTRLGRDIPGLAEVHRVSSGFYTSTCMEWHA